MKRRGGRDPRPRQPSRTADTSSWQPPQPQDSMTIRFPLTLIDDGTGNHLRSHTLVNKDLNIDEFGSMESDNEDSYNPPINQNYPRDTKFISGNYGRSSTHDIFPTEGNYDGISLEDHDGLPIQVSAAKQNSANRVNFIRSTDPGSAIFHKTAHGIPTEDYDGLPIQVPSAQRKPTREPFSPYRVNYVRSSESDSSSLKTVGNYNCSSRKQGQSSLGASNFLDEENPPTPDYNDSSSNVSTLIQALSEWGGQEALKTLGSIDPSGLHDIDTDAVLRKAKLAVIQELIKTCPRNSGKITTDSNPKVASNINRFPSTSKNADREKRASHDRKLKLSWHSAPVDRRIGESSIQKAGNVGQSSNMTHESPKKVKPPFLVLSGVKSAPEKLPHNSNSSSQIYQVGTPPVLANRLVLPTNRVIPSGYRTVGPIASSNTSVTPNSRAFPPPSPVNQMMLSGSGPVPNNVSATHNPFSFAAPNINNTTPTSITGYGVSTGSYGSSLNTLVRHNSTSLSFSVSAANQNNVLRTHVMANFSAPPPVLVNTTTADQSHLLHHNNPLPYGQHMPNNVLMNIRQSPSNPSPVSVDKSVKNIQSNIQKMDIQSVMEKSREFINDFKRSSVPRYTKSLHDFIFCSKSSVKRSASRSPPPKTRSPLRKSKSPLRRRTARSPPIQRARSPLSRRSKSPIRGRASRSPPRKARSPLSKSRNPVRRRTSRSPPLRRVRSPLFRRSRSPVRRRAFRSPPQKAWSPLRRSNSPVRRRVSRSPPLRRARSPILLERTKSPARRRASRSPPLRKARSPLLSRSMSPKKRWPVSKPGNASTDKISVRTSTQSPQRISTTPGRDDKQSVRSNDRQRSQSPGQKGQQQIGKDNKKGRSESPDKKDSQIKRSKDGRGTKNTGRKNTQLVDEKGSRQSNTDKREDCRTSDKDLKPKSNDSLNMEGGTWLSNTRENTRLVCERKCQPNISKYSKGSNLRLAKLSQAVDRILPQVPRNLNVTAAKEENNSGGLVYGSLSEQSAQAKVISSDTSKNQEANSLIAAGTPHRDTDENYQQATESNNSQLETPGGKIINSELKGGAVISEATSNPNVDSKVSEMSESIKEVEISVEPDSPSAKDVPSLNNSVGNPTNPSHSDKDVSSVNLFDDETADDVLDFDEEPSLFHSGSSLSNVEEEKQSASMPLDDEQWTVADEVACIREKVPQSSETSQETADTAHPDCKILPTLVDDSEEKLKDSVKGDDCERKEGSVGNNNQSKEINGRHGHLLQSSTSKLSSSQTDMNISEDDVKAITLKFNEELVKIKMEVQKTATMAVKESYDCGQEAMADPSSEENRKTEGSHKLQMLLDEIDDVDKHIQDLIAEVDENELGTEIMVSGTEGDLGERSGIESTIVSEMVVEEANTPDVMGNQSSEGKINISDVTIEKFTTVNKSVEDIEKTLLQNGSVELHAQIRQGIEAKTARKMFGEFSRLGPNNESPVDPEIDTRSALAGHKTNQSAEELQNTGMESIDDTTIASDDALSHLYIKTATIAVKDCDDHISEEIQKVGGSHKLQILLDEVDDVDKPIQDIMAEGNENELDTEIMVKESGGDLEKRVGIESKMSEMVAKEANNPDFRDNQSSEDKINVSDVTIEKQPVEEIEKLLLQSGSEENQAQLRQGIQAKTARKMFGEFPRLGPSTETSVDPKIDTSSALAGHKTNQSAEELQNTRIESVDDTATASDDPVSHLYSKTPQKIILLKPESNVLYIERDIVEFSVKHSLNSDGFCFSSINVAKGQRVGAPYDHVQVVFNSVEESIKWYEKHKGTIRLAYAQGNPKSIEFSFHYTLENWRCKITTCMASNFWCRSMCYSCCTHKDLKRGVKFGGVKSTLLGVKRLGFDEKQILRKLNLGSFEWKLTATSLRIVYDRAMNCFSGLCLIKCSSMKKTKALKSILIKRFPYDDVAFAVIDDIADEVNSTIRCQFMDVSVAVSSTDSYQPHRDGHGRPRKHASSDDLTSFDHPSPADHLSSRNRALSRDCSRSRNHAERHDHSRSSNRIQRRDRNSSASQTRRHDRSRSRNRSRRRDQSRSKNRTRLRDRSQSGSRSQRRDRSCYGNHSQPHDHGQSGNRSRRRDRSRSRNRTRLRDRSHSGSSSQRHDRSHSENQIQHRDRSHSGSHSQRHDRSCYGNHSQPHDHGQSGNRSRRRDRSRSRSRTRLRDRSHSGSSSQRRERSHSGNYKQSRDNSCSSSHVRPHDRSRSGSHERPHRHTHSDYHRSPGVDAPELSKTHSPSRSPERYEEFPIFDRELDSALSRHSSLRLTDEHSDSEFSSSSRHSYDFPGVSTKSSPHRDDAASPSRPPKPNGFGDFIYRLPDIKKFTFEESTGLYFDPYTTLYYDSDKDLFYNDDLDVYLVYKFGKYVCI